MKGNKTSPPASAPTADEPQTLTAHQLKLARAQAQAQAAMQAFLNRAALNVGAERPAGSGNTKVGADHPKRSV